MDTGPTTGVTPHEYLNPAVIADVAAAVFYRQPEALAVPGDVSLVDLVALVTTPAQFAADVVVAVYDRAGFAHQVQEIDPRAFLPPGAADIHPGDLLDRILAGDQAAIVLWRMARADRRPTTRRVLSPIAWQRLQEMREAVLAELPTPATG